MSDDCETSEPNVKKSRMDEENVLLNKAEKKLVITDAENQHLQQISARAKTYTKFHLIWLIRLIQNTPSFHH